MEKNQKKSQKPLTLAESLSEKLYLKKLKEQEQKMQEQQEKMRKQFLQSLQKKTPLQKPTPPSLLSKLKSLLSNLKKKLLEQIMLAAEELGDPTDPETGWDVHFKRVKTGPQVYNVEYQLQVLKCKVRALDKDEAALVAGLQSMDDILPRPTAESQKEFLENLMSESAGSIPNEVEEELKTEDLPY